MGGRKLNARDIAVVIPTLNEAARLPPLLASLAVGGWGAVVVADGGSVDATAAVAMAARGVALVRAERGRGRQMNAGAEAAGCVEVFLFLHADTQLPANAAAVIARAFTDPAVVGSAFRLAFDRRDPLLDLYAACSRFEFGWTTFGDQAFAIRRSAFETVGGFPEQPLLEDLEMRRRLRRLGRFVKLDAAVTTSARRFEAEGLVRRQLKNGVILTLHALGASPESLVRLYR